MSMANATEELHATLVVSFRGKQVEILLTPGLTVQDVQTHVASAADPALGLSSSDIKLLHKGKILGVTSNANPNNVYELLTKGKNPSSGNQQKRYRLLATGVSSTEATAHEDEIQASLKNGPRIRDDLTKQGQADIARRQRLGRSIMRKHGGRQSSSSSQYGFGRIETLPMLPDQATAKQILTKLANDPGVLACMAKHKWRVGSLAELYPEGKVGESQVCVMGLNKNKGQQILLRIRTDDLQGFRKLQSIRKVLFHELAHNVYSEHDGDFFQLMRQIERECNELDWTQGAGLSSSNDGAGEVDVGALYIGGSYRLGGERELQQGVPVRELAARAAMMRMTAEEEEIEQHCGCGKEVTTRPTEAMDASTDSDCLNDRN